ncbi:MAG: hypothetical protein CMM01_23405 [Rhodopirellula sp.]|nr:hypothetical protein [Rhodopirellula sp.]
MPSSHEWISRKETPLPPLRSPVQFRSDQQADQPSEDPVGTQQSVSSPCNGTCVLSAHDGVCLGCFRTKAEIANWMSASDEERGNIVKRCGDRQGASQAVQKNSGNLEAEGGK